MAILIIAEHNHVKINASTLPVVTAAQIIANMTDTKIDLLICGHNIDSVIESVSDIGGINQIVAIDDKSCHNLLAEVVAGNVINIANSYEYILAPATSFGKDLLPRVAAILGVEQISDVIQIISANSFMRPIYAGNALETVSSSDKIKIMTIRATAFSYKAQGGNTPAVIRQAAVNYGQNTAAQFISHEQIESDQPPLTSAKIVISGGRALGSRDNFALLEKIAKRLNAAVGASRAAVDEGYIANDRQVGQTGQIVAPDLYIAVGISGAIQHLAGMKDSRVIVAINKDPEAAIFQIADYGIIGDLFQILPELDAELAKQL